MVRVNKVTSVVPRPSLVPEQQASVVAKEEPVSFSHFLLPSDVEDIDAGDENNALLATEYVNDIYAYLRSLEVSSLIRKISLTNDNVSHSGNKQSALTSYRFRRR